MNSEASITRIRLCLLEDSASDARLIQYNLQKTFGSALHLEMFPRLEALLQYLASEPDVDLIISDLGLPDSNGLETVERLVERVPDVPIVVMTGSADEEQALEDVYWLPIEELRFVFLVQKGSCLHELRVVLLQQVSADAH